MADIRKNAMELVKSVIADTTVYKADNITRNKCPVCGKYMLLVNGKRGKMLACQDRACGFRQPEKQDNYGYKSSRGESRQNQKLIEQFSQQDSIGSNIGELLKAAMAKGNKDESKK